MSERDPTLSTQELADALGVSLSSVKRWIDNGRIQAIRTTGGHRRIRTAEALRVIRAHNGKSTTPIGLDSEGVEASLLKYSHALRFGDEDAAVEVVLDRLLLGEPLGALLDSPVFEAYRTLRAECSHPSRECVVLHRALAISRKVVAALCGPTLTRSRNANSVVLLGDLGKEVDSLPTVLAEAIFASRGFRCVQLGAGVDVDVFAGAIDRLKPKLVWLCARGSNKQTTATAHAIVHASESCRAVLVGLGDLRPFLPIDRLQRMHLVARFSELEAMASSWQLSEDRES